MIPQHLDYRPVPCDEMTERQVISSMMQGGNDVIDEVCFRLNEDSFHLEVNRIFFRHLRKMREENQPIDFTLLAANIRDAGDAAAIGGFGSISIWWNYAFTLDAEIVGNAIKRVYEEAAVRRTIAAAHSVIDAAYDITTSPAELESYVERLREIKFQFPQEQKDVPQSTMKIQMPDESESSLIQDRYLCRSGGLLLVGPTGIGKSSFVMQLSFSLALGRECFGIKPSQPLRTLLIQAENDDGDIVLMRDGVLRGMKINNVSSLESLHFHRRIDDKSGLEVCGAIDKYLEQFKECEMPIDLVILDPAFAYIGGDALSQKDVTAFLRNGINPMIRKHNCGIIIVHHTNKPIRSSELGARWSAGDFAYLGAGSAEWANWPRAVLAICNIGSHEIFELSAPKRGANLRWRDGNDERVYSRYIAHATGESSIYWREPDKEEVEELLNESGSSSSKTGREKYPSDKLLEFLPATAEEISSETNMPVSSVKKLLSKLVKRGAVIPSRLPGEENVFVRTHGFR